MSVKSAKQYVEDILSGKKIANKYVKQAVDRYVKDLKRTDIYLDEQAAEHVFEFFSFVSLVEGDMAGQKFNPTPEQSFIILNVFGFKKTSTNTRRFRVVDLEVARKFGKMLALDTLVPTPNGFSTMGSLREGDIIFGGDGKPCRVLKKSDIDYSPESYMVTFSNGEKIKACADHQWQLSDFGEKKVVTTRDIYNGTAYFPYTVECSEPTLEKVGKYETMYGFNYIYITDVEPIDPVPMQCIEVDSFDSTYLVGETFVRTHNTTFLSVLGLYGLFGDGENRAQIYSGGTTKDQASICFDTASLIAQGTPEFDGHLTVRSRSLSHLDTASFFKYMASDTKKLDGFNPHFAILDEVHAYKDNSMYEIFKSGMVGRSQPIIFMITTAGFYKTWWYYKTQRKHLVRVLNGEAVDDSLFGMIWTLDEGDDWQEEKVWVKAIPSLGYNIEWDAIRERVLEAKNKPSDRNAILTKQFNIWTDGVKTWIPIQDWNKLENKRKDGELVGLQAFGGVDLSYIRDITAYTLNFKLENGKRYLRHRFFVPEETAIARQASTGIPYADWIRDGHLITNSGNTIDYDLVKRHIIDDFERFNIHTLGFDKFNSSHIMQEINDVVGQVRVVIEGKASYINKCYGITPHIRAISPPTKELERMIICDNPEIEHDGNPVMAWMLGNVALKFDPDGNVKPDKERSEEKIDGVYSTILSIEQQLFWSDKDLSGKSIYEDKDILIL